MTSCAAAPLDRASWCRWGQRRGSGGRADGGGGRRRGRRIGREPEESPPSDRETVVPKDGAQRDKYRVFGSVRSMRVEEGNRVNLTERVAHLSEIPAEQEKNTRIPNDEK